jgi:SAM-dependent methyltransferase
MKQEWLSNTEYIQRCLSGEELLGDSFTQSDIDHWFSIEEHAYADMSKANAWTKKSLFPVLVKARRKYSYNAINCLHAFSKLPDVFFENVLGFGSAYCDEFIPIMERIGRVDVIEPGDIFTEHHLVGKDVTYHKPTASGDMIFNENSFDLVVCFSALHHIPNVSKIISEFSRVMKPGAWLLIREPTTSMGNWYEERKGATPCERGIPPKLMRNFIMQNGLTLRHTSLCGFPVLQKFLGIIGLNPSYAFYAWVDAILSFLFQYNYTYYTNNVWSKIRPGARFYVCTK